MVKDKASRALSPADPWQWLRGYWLAPVNITGCCMSVWPVVRKLTLCPHRCGYRLAPFGCTQPPLCLAPLRPCARHQRCSCRAQYQSMCGHGFAIATGNHSQALRAVMEVGPARPPSAPKGLPSVLPPPRELPPLTHQRSAVLPASRVRFAALCAPLTRLRAPLCGVGQRRSP